MGQSMTMVSDLSARIGTALRQEISIGLRVAGEAIDWAELKRRIAVIDDALSAADIPPGSTVGVLGRNTMASATVLLALVATGRCAAIVNPFRSGEAVMESVRKLDTAALILSQGDAVAECAADFDGLFLLGPAGQCSPRLRDGRAAGGAKVGGVERDGILISTSGTTGDPKYYHLSLAVLSRAMAEIEAFNAGFGDAPDSDGGWRALIQYSSLSHIAGVLTVLRGAGQGRQTIIMPKFDPHHWADIVEEARPLTTGLPPSMMRMVLDAEIAPERLSSLVSVWSGSAPVRAEDRQRFTQAHGLPVLGNYGATEFCGAIAAWSLADHRDYAETRGQAVGRIDRRHTEVRVRSTEGKLLPEGETGVLEFRLERIGPDWIATSDLGAIDREGFLTLHGRKDDAIVRGGFKLSPKIIMDAIRAHPDIRDVAVVGLPDKRLGEVPVAAVELHRADGITPDGVREYVRARLPAYYVPVAVCVVPSLPRNAAMKLDRRAIARLFSD